MKEFKIVTLLGMLLLAINGAWFHLVILYIFGIFMLDNPFWIIEMIEDVFNTGDKNK